MGVFSVCLLVFFVSFFLIHFTHSIFAAGNTYYVATDGSNSNPGTESQPFLTLNYAITHLSAGDTLYIKPGTYAEALYDVVPAGTDWNNPVKIVAYDSNNKPVLQPTSAIDRVLYFSGTDTKYIEVDGLILDGINLLNESGSGDTLKITLGANHIRIKNSTIKNAYSQGILITNSSDNNEFINLDVYDNGRKVGGVGLHGFYIQTDYNIIENCRIHDNRNQGIQLRGDSQAADYTIIRNNEIYDNGDRGIVSWGGTGNELYNNIIYNNVNNAGIDVSESFDKTKEIKFYNNTVYGNSTGILINNADSGEYRNNIVYNNTNKGIELQSSSDNAVITNNLVAASNTNYLDSGTNTQLSNNLIGNSYDPRFVDVNNHDFSIQGSSDGRDQGYSIVGFTTDFLGNPRPTLAGYDIGAYEYQPPVVNGTWTQTDWSGGSGQSAWVATDKYLDGVNAQTPSGSFSIPTGAWYDASWQYRKPISIDNSYQPSDLNNFQLRVVLDSSNFEFDKAKSDGSDIRFTANDGVTLLDYEIEYYSQADETATLWVQVPSITGSSTNGYIYMYYGNEAAADASNSSGVWDNNYIAVYHLSDYAMGRSAASSSIGGSSYDLTYGNFDEDANSSKAVDTISGKGVHLDGAGDKIRNDVASPPAALKLESTNFTVVSWVKKDTAADAGAVTGTHHGTTGWASGFVSNSILKFNMGNGTSSNENQQYDFTGNLNSTNWLMVANTYTYGGNLSYYVNTALAGTKDPAYEIVGLGGRFTIGCYPNYTGTAECIDGYVDEVWLLNEAKDSNWITAMYQNTQGNMSSVGNESVYSPLPTTVITSSIFDTTALSIWGTLSYTSTIPSSTTVAVNVRSGNSADLSDATDFSTCSAIADDANLSTSSCVTNGERYLQYQVTLTSTDPEVTPTFEDITFTFASDTIAPTGSISLSQVGETSQVNATLSVSDDVPDDSMQMRVTDGDINDASWESFSSEKSFTICSPGATVTLYAQFKDNSENVSEVYSDSLVCQPVPTPTPAPTANPSSGSSASGDTPSPRSCSAEKPVSAPDLFQINSKATTGVTLFFAPVLDKRDRYYVSYSTSPNAEEFGFEFTNDAHAVISVDVQALKPNTVYYVKVRAGNGCQPGDWSNILTVRTGQRIPSYRWSSLPRIVSTAVRRQRQLSSVQNVVVEPTPNPTSTTGTSPSTEGAHPAPTVSSSPTAKPSFPSSQPAPSQQQPTQQTAPSFLERVTDFFRGLLRR